MIKHIYEDNNILLDSIPMLIHDVCTGNIKNVTEKLDGRNFTFTICPDSGFLYVGKGGHRKEGYLGLDRNGLIRRYGAYPSHCSVMLDAFDNISAFFQKIDQEIIDNVFMKGKMSVTAELLHPDYQNVIRYQQKEVRLHGLASGGNFSQPDVFKDLCKSILGPAGSWVIGGPRYAKHHRRLDCNIMMNRFIDEFKKLRVISGCVAENSTMGDMRANLIKRHLKGIFPDVIMTMAAERLASGNKGAFNKKKASGYWQLFQEIEERRYEVLCEALFPLEEFFRSFGNYALSFFDLINAQDAHRGLNDIKTRVAAIKKAHDMSRIVASPQQFRRIKAELHRCKNVQNMKSYAEGIVFDWPKAELGRKLVGYFTPVNSLFGIFRYGKQPARII